MAYSTGFECLKTYGARLNSVIYAIGQDDIEILMESRADYEKFSSLLIAKFKKNPKYLDHLIVWSENHINSLYDFINKNLNEKIIRRLSNQEIAERYLKYSAEYLAYHLKNTPSWWIGAIAAEEALREYLVANYPDENIDNLLSVIIDPVEYPSENFKEELSLLDIASKFRKGGYRRVDKVENLPSSIITTLQKHTILYGSLPFGYKTGLVWVEEDFFNRLQLLIKKDPTKLKKSKLLEIKKKKLKRNKVIAGLGLPPDMNNLVLALQKLACLQELKKTAQTRSHPILQLVVKKEIARRLRIAAEYLDYLNEREIAKLLKAGSINQKFLRALKQRQSFSVNIIKNVKSHWLVGRAAKKFIKNNGLLLNTGDLQEIKGQIASGGLVRGKVKICLFSTELNKIKSGDILVTAMTTPDFVPAMRRAAAIVTDEGGITSHAAIVARELHKPCIIGTKVAAKILQDGDLVEVDANKGIIRRLS